MRILHFSILQSSFRAAWKLSSEKAKKATFVLDVISSIPSEKFTENVCNLQYYIDEEWKQHGVVAWFQKYRGTIRAPMNLRDFPFDRQLVKFVSRSTWKMTPSQ
jgi:hypothetical protein